MALLQAHSTIFPPKPKSSAARRSQPSPNPSQPSTIRSCTSDTIHTTGQCESRSNVGDGGDASIEVVKSAWAGDVRWVCSRGEWTGTPPHPPPSGSQAACTSLPLLRTLMPVRTPPTPHRCTASTARRRDILECTCCSEGGCSDPLFYFRFGGISEEN